MPGNTNNRAHACLWFFEIWHHNQRDVPFVPAVEWGTSFLIKSSAGESRQLPGNAQPHAEMLAGAFISLCVV